MAILFWHFHRLVTMNELKCRCTVYTGVKINKLSTLYTDKHTTCTVHTYRLKIVKDSEYVTYFQLIVVSPLTRILICKMKCFSVWGRWLNSHFPLFQFNVLYRHCVKFSNKHFLNLFCSKLYTNSRQRTHMSNLLNWKWEEKERIISGRFDVISVNVTASFRQKQNHWIYWKMWILCANKFPTNRSSGCAQTFIECNRLKGTTFYQQNFDDLLRFVEFNCTKQQKEKGLAIISIEELNKNTSCIVAWMLTKRRNMHNA